MKTHGDEIRIEIAPMPGVSDNILLDDFAQKIGNLNAALSHADRLASGRASSSVVFELIRLSYNSPATVILRGVSHSAAIPNYPETVCRKFFDIVGDLNQGRIKHEYSRPLLETFRALGSGIDERISSIKIGQNGSDMAFTKQLVTNISEILSQDVEVVGSIMGTLEYINLHRKDVPMFRIYPVIGASFVNCFFGPELREDAKNAVDAYVEVFGTMKYRSRENNPEEIRVTKIDKMPQDDQLPKIFDLKGIAPKATGKLASENFVAKRRSDEW